MKPSLVVMAAGMGSRYGDLKQMDTFGPSGETIVDYTVFDAKRVGFEKVVFIIRKSFENQFKEKYKAILNEMDVCFVFQELDNLPDELTVPENRVKPWGTGHAVWTAHHEVGEPFAVVNADDFYGKSSLQLIYEHLKSTNDEQLSACLVAYQLKNTLSEFGSVSRGLCEISEEGFLRSITEKTEIHKGQENPYYVEDGKHFELTGNEPVSMNLMGFTAKVFEEIASDFIRFHKKSADNPKAEYYIPTVVDNVRTAGNQVPVLLTNDVWFGVTYKEDKVAAQHILAAMVKEGVYPERLWTR